MRSGRKWKPRIIFSPDDYDDESAVNCGESAAEQGAQLLAPKTALRITVPEKRERERVDGRPARAIKAKVVFSPEAISGRRSTGTLDTNGASVTNTGVTEGKISKEPSQSPRVKNVAATGEINQWVKLLNRFKRLTQALKNADHFLSVTLSEKRGEAGRVELPIAEIQRLEAVIVAKKRALRALMQEISSMNSQHKRWDALRSSEDDGDDDDGISLGDVYCSVCFGEDDDDGNDILICDRAGCYRAYHQKCLDPPLAVLTEDHKDPNMDWFCWQCDCIDKCLDEVSDYVDAFLVDEHALFPEIDRMDAQGAAVTTTSSGSSSSSSSSNGSDKGQDCDGGRISRSGRRRRAPPSLITNEVVVPGSIMGMSFGSDSDSDEAFEEDEEEDDEDDEEERDIDEVDDNDDSDIGPCMHGDSPTSQTSSVCLEPDGDAVSQRNIISGRRKRGKVDYELLALSMFGNLTDDDADDGWEGESPRKFERPSIPADEDEDEDAGGAGDESSAYESD